LTGDEIKIAERQIGDSRVIESLTQTVQCENRRLTTVQKWLMATVLTGVTCLAAQLSAKLPFTPVPVTMQVFAVLLSGLLLGSRWGAVVQVQYLLLGFSGAPVFALGTGGISVLLFPHVTGGYLLSYPLAAFLVGWISERAEKRQHERQAATQPAYPIPDHSGIASLRGRMLACGAGLIVIYGFGCTWLAFLSRPLLTPLQAVILGAGWFVAWDACKALAAVAVVQKLRRRSSRVR